MGFLIILILLAGCLTAFGYYSYRKAFFVPKTRKEDLFHVPEGPQYHRWGQKMIEISLIMEEASHEEVFIHSRDGLLLHGRFYEYYPGAPVILAFHGYRSMAVRDCAGAFALAQKLGFNILAVDQRAHGKSEGNTIAFGIRERFDCLQWIDYLCQRLGQDRPVILTGISMGAATVLMAAGEKLPENVACVMADCPYDTPAGIIAKVAREQGYPNCLAEPVIALGARLFAALDLQEATAAKAVQQARVPILLIHGEDDRFVPCDMSRNIAANCGSHVTLHTFPEAGHGLCYIIDPRRYEKICVDFLWQFPALRPALERSEFAQRVHQSG